MQSLGRGEVFTSKKGGGGFFWCCRTLYSYQGVGVGVGVGVGCARIMCTPPEVFFSLCVQKRTPSICSLFKNPVKKKKIVIAI